MRPLLTTIIFFLILGSTALGAEIRLSAAASMTDAVKALTTNYKENKPNVTIQTNFASSGILAQQISLGAPTDIFISANARWMDYLITERYISTDSISTLAGNSLVFIGSKELSIPSLSALSKLKLIAIGSPKSVPAGQYAVQALKTAGLYDRLQGKLVMAKDARQALVYADRGETDGAFVYKTDALLAQEAIILLEVPQALYTEITYPVGITATGSANREAVAFFDFLKTETARSILKAHGFELNQIRQPRTGDSY